MGLSEHSPLTAVAEGKTFVLGDFLLMEARCTFEYLSVGLICQEEIHVLIKSKVSLVPDIIRQPTEF